MAIADGTALSLSSASAISLKPGFHPNSTHATQSIALRALRKRKPQTWQAFDWLLQWLAVSIDHSYWLALACVAFEWKPVLRNVFCLHNFIAFIAFLAHFSYAIACALRALRKRKPQETQALALASSHGCHCFDRAFLFLLAGACVCCVKNSRNKRNSASQECSVDVTFFPTSEYY